VFLKKVIKQVSVPCEAAWSKVTRNSEIASAACAAARW
jgi:hypothetical protein